MSKRKDIVVKHSFAFSTDNISCVAAKIVGNNGNYSKRGQYDFRNEYPATEEQLGHLEASIDRYTENNPPPASCDYRLLRTPKETFIVFVQTHDSEPKGEKDARERTKQVRVIARDYLDKCFSESIPTNHGVWGNYGARQRIGQSRIIETLKEEGILVETPATEKPDLLTADDGVRLHDGKGLTSSKAAAVGR